jgi:predicted ATPase/class 3 adenylate cyclase/Flp pilus assembly protein TadD
MRSELPSGTVTFLFTDVEGSTKLLSELGEQGYADALAEHRRMIREACAAEDGVEVDTQGDAFFFAFPTAPGALAAAEAFTERLAASGPIRVRVGLHTGTPLRGEEGYVGHDLHRAARIAASGHGGQVVLSPSTVRLLERGAFILTDLGEHRFKDIAEPVPIFQLGEERFPPLKTISNTNLPRPASSFLGREVELAEVVSRIEQGARLVTLTGPGGTGKTRLALEAATTLVPSYKAGVFWVGLASLRDPALVPETIAQTLGAKDGLAEHIGARELLLLLDNLEQVIDAAPELGSLLSACPNLTLLVTSRELLRVQGEVEYPVPPLATPEGVDLFCARAQLEPSGEIAELCARLDSLPLSLELAAARTKALTPAQILERLADRLDLLKGGRDADPRQQTLRATIEWSYELLSADEQELFARLSVFAGGCTLEAAEEVCDADLDGLQSLVQKSLLRFTPSDSGGRYWMLETIREYAGERLGEANETHALVERHGRWCLELARGWESHSRGPEYGAWSARLEAEHGNVRFALERARGERPLLVVELAGLLWRYWLESGFVVEGLTWLEAALASLSTEATPERERLLAGGSWCASACGDRARARRWGEERLEVARALADDSAQSKALGFLSAEAADEGDFERAVALGEESVEIARGRGLPVAIALHNLGYVFERAGELARAEQAYLEALELHRASGDAGGIDDANHSLGTIALVRGDPASARDFLTTSARLSLGTSRRVNLPSTLVLFAELEASEKRFDRAAKLLGAADASLDEIGTALLPHHADRYDLLHRRVAERLGASESERMQAQGRGMSLEEAVVYALEGSG